MAEVVHKKLEAMLPELEELERVGIFNRSEIREIVRKRQKFEYRMLRRPAKKEDFLQAIQVRTVSLKL
jgi:U3 small nucleolar RNA-associated protein 6